MISDLVVIFLQKDNNLYGLLRLEFRKKHLRELYLQNLTKILIVSFKINKNIN